MKKSITTKDGFGRENTYQIVEKIPSNYFVWNIGEHIGTHEYIPIAQWLRPGVKDDYSINPDTLKAVPVSVDEWPKIMKAASGGIHTLKDAEKALRSKRKGPESDRKRKLSEMTIDIFKRIS